MCEGDEVFVGGVVFKFLLKGGNVNKFCVFVFDDFEEDLSNSGVINKFDVKLVV